ncbi:hypothetical protein Cs7R123_77570 [Catellatospora sp. TT07R-123]|uniref:DUF4190 domain-containing protein n=1 Tax=Catellatospora sp. TT07R-123 TaxID=2733863 RepID=UPI001B0A2906|nr:DUF4190 domain-containing protein [Catellatospora sp. TT07R-123]GHJ50415.1 hypothetical protein Cs7R123_77570 [Catellatospora sp. TT07R-123]
MTYPPPPGQDPYGNPPAGNPYAPQPPATPDPYAVPATPDPYSVPPASGSPYQQPPVSAQPYGQYAYGQQPYPQPASGGTNGMAIASLVLGIAGVLTCCCYGFGALPGLIGAILGHLSMKQIRERNQDGRGLAIAGIATGWAGVALSVGMLALIVIGVVSDPNLLNDIQNGSR